MTDIVEEIRNYVREENPIWSKEVFDEMLNCWSNQKELTLYRGINFRDKDSYESFVAQFNENGGYIQGSASSFSADIHTAEGFAKISKSYFLDRDVMKASSVQNTLGEKIAGYRGVVLKITVPPGSVVDVQKSGEAIENEYLFKPNELIKAEFKDLKSFFDITREPGFDPNKSLEDEILKIQKQKEPILNNSWVRYLLINHIDEIKDENKTLICQNDFAIELKRRKELKPEELNESDRTLLHHQKEVTVIKYKSYRLSSGAKKPDEIHIQPISFSHFDEYDLITKDFKRIIRKIASEVLQVAMDIHIEHRDDKNSIILYNGVKELEPYLTKDEKELYVRMVGYGVKNTYEDLGEKIRENFSNTRKRSDSIDEMKKFLSRIIENSPSKENTNFQEKEQRRKRIDEAKKYRLEAFGLEDNIEPNNQNPKMKF